MPSKAQMKREERKRRYREQKRKEQECQSSPAALGQASSPAALGQASCIDCKESPKAFLSSQTSTQPNASTFSSSSSVERSKLFKYYEGNLCTKSEHTVFQIQAVSSQAPSSSSKPHQTTKSANYSQLQAKLLKIQQQHNSK